MGVWETALFANDLACDVRDDYRERIEDGIEDAEATRQTVQKFAKWFADPEDGTTAILALAVTQSKTGRLDPAIRDQALAVLDRGGDLRVWEQENPKLLAKRRAVLARAREQLTGPQPARKRLKAPVRYSCGLSAGDVLALDLPGGPALLRTVRIHSHRKGETPYLEELEFSGADVPSQKEIEHLQAKATGHIAMVSARAPNARFLIISDVKGGGWREAGFKKVCSISARVGDDHLSHSGYGTRWPALADRYRARRSSERKEAGEHEPIG